MASKPEVLKAIAQLVRAGVEQDDAARLIAACQIDDSLVLALISLAGEPVVGDRLRAVVARGGPQSLVVVDAAESRELVLMKHRSVGLSAGPSAHRPLRRWAVVGRPVAPSSSDAAILRARGRNHG